jgi:DNA mismatch repair protein MutL
VLFRSSIASVSQVEIITKTKEAETGVHIEINGGEIVANKDVAATKGTSITIRNLFYNTPARRKFLKKAATESGYISDVITKLALGNPGIAFKYINNGSELIRTKGDGRLESVIYQIYGKETASCILPVNYAKEEVKITGYICKPEMYRSNRSYEHMFINGRHIKSEIISSAVEQALKTMFPIGKFPVFFLFIQIDPLLIDVNVHPTKLEVRFWNENKMFEIVHEAIKRAVAGNILIPEVSWKNDKSEEKEDVFVSEAAIAEHTKPKVQTYADIIKSMYDDKPLNKNDSEINAISANESGSQPRPYREIYEEQPGGIFEDELKNSPASPPPNVTDTSANIEKSKVAQEKPAPLANYKIVGQIFDTYWIIEQGSTMYVMDQHAAHERFLYEQISKKLSEKTDILSQPVLSPSVLVVTPMEMSVIEENITLFTEFGFDIDKFGEKEIAIRAVPYLLKDAENTNFFLEIVDKLAKVETSVSNIYEMKTDAIAKIACAAAVKGNDKLNYAEAKELIDKVLKLENPFTCPHGRPTIIEMSKYELEKRFKRVI